MRTITTHSELHTSKRNFAILWKHFFLPFHKKCNWANNAKCFVCLRPRTLYPFKPATAGSKNVQWVFFAQQFDQLMLRCSGTESNWTSSALSTMLHEKIFQDREFVMLSMNRALRNIKYVKYVCFRTFHVGTIKLNNWKLSIGIKWPNILISFWVPLNYYYCAGFIGGFMVGEGKRFQNYLQYNWTRNNLTIEFSLIGLLTLKT